MTGGPVSDLAGMLAGMAPMLDTRRWAFVVARGAPPEEAFAIIREDEGTTAILPDPAGDFARITLMVHSALDGVGLTAAVASALAERGSPAILWRGSIMITCLCRGRGGRRRWRSSSTSLPQPDHSPSR